MPHLAVLGPAALILLPPLILLILLLLVPIDLEGRVARGGVCPETRMRIGWLFGRLSKDVFGAAAEREPSEKGQDRGPEREGDEGEEDREAGGGLGPARVVLEVLRTDGFLGTLENLLRGLLGAIQVQLLRIDIVLGLPDPADTGEAVGLLWAALFPLEALAPLRARIAPAFSEERLEAEAEGRLRVVPIKIVPPLALFVLSPPTWRASLRAIKARRGKR